MDLRLSGRRALVLGSSSGMGRAIAAGLSAEGTSVFVTERDPEEIAEAVRVTGAAGSEMADLTRPGEPQRLV